jgi:hypothetical protein
MSKRLSKVVVRRLKESYKSLLVVTKIANLGY